MHVAHQHMVPCLSSVRQVKVAKCYATCLFHSTRPTRFYQLARLPRQQTGCMMLRKCQCLALFTCTGQVQPWSENWSSAENLVQIEDVPLVPKNLFCPLTTFRREHDGRAESGPRKGPSDRVEPGVCHRHSWGRATTSLESRACRSLPMRRWMLVVRTVASGRGVWTTSLLGKHHALVRSEGQTRCHSRRYLQGSRKGR